MNEELKKDVNAYLEIVVGSGDLREAKKKVGLMIDLATLAERKRCAELSYKSGREFQHDKMPPLRVAEQIGYRIESDEQL